MRFASFYPHCFLIFEKARKTAKKEENPRKSRVFWGASFLTPHLGCGGGIWTSRPPGYEPDELPGCSTPRYEIGAGNRGRTGTRKISRDFKSRASANSAIPAYYRSVTCHNSIAHPFPFVKGSAKKDFYLPRLSLAPFHPFAIKRRFFCTFTTHGCRYFGARIRKTSSRGLNRRGI